MFQADDVIIYGSHGVCRIVDISEQRINGSIKKYYVLKPVQDHGATIFAPMDNENVCKKMRRLLSAEQIDRIIDTLPEEPEVLPEKDSDRKELYKRLLAGSDPAQLMKMIQTVYCHRKQRLARGSVCTWWMSISSRMRSRFCTTSFSMSFSWKARKR
jgi:CarD family transcriptional regulator